MIAFDYKSHSRLEVEPHILGLSRTGNLLLSCYQNKGSGAHSKVPGWKNMLVSEMSNLRLIDKSFAAPQPNYNPADPSFSEIIAALEGY